MEKHTNLIYQGSDNRSSLYDLFLVDDSKDQALVVFIHGYTGYKDWGCWNLMGDAIANNGYSFAKFTITHSATTVEHSTEFVDLEAFGNGGYLKELRDLQYFLDHLEKTHGFKKFILVGHSRGGGAVILGGNDERVKQIHCLAPISDIAARFPKGEKMEEWKKTGVYFHKNSRTGTELPHYFCQYEDFLAHQEELTIEIAAKKLQKPVFVYHGSDDTSVEPWEGKLVAEWTNGTYYNIEGTAHTFDTKEPWTENKMPETFAKVVQMIVTTISNQINPF